MMAPFLYALTFCYIHLPRGLLPFVPLLFVLNRFRLASVFLMEKCKVEGGCQFPKLLACAVGVMVKPLLALIGKVFLSLVRCLWQGYSYVYALWFSGLLAG